MTARYCYHLLGCRLTPETRVRKRVNDVAVSTGPHGSGRGQGEKAGAGTAGGVRAHQRAPAVPTLSAGMGSSCPRQRSRTLSGAASRGGEECLDSPPPITYAAVTYGANGCQRTFRRARSS